MHRVIWHGRTGDPHGDRVFDGLASIGVGEVMSVAATALRESSPAEDCFVAAEGMTGRCDEPS